MAASSDTAKPTPLQKSAERPVEAKIVPIFVKAGSSKSRSLFSNDSSTGFFYNNLYTHKRKIGRALLLPSRSYTLFQGLCQGLSFSSPLLFHRLELICSVIYVAFCSAFSLHLVLQSLF